MELIDGLKIAAAELKKHKNTARLLKKKHKKIGLAAVIVGDNPASRLYVSKKKEYAEKISVYSRTLVFPSRITEKKFLNEINKLNNDSEITGILVQLPLPPHINELKVCSAILPEKDVDGFHPFNLGKLVTGDFGVIPCTPAGILTVFKKYKIKPEGKFTVIIGRSNIVSKPLANILIQKKEGLNATVCVCHSRTRNLKEITKKADILITAIGVPEFITAGYIKKGAIIIDVGINRAPDKTRASGYRLCGDVDFKSVYKKCGMITPVPGGVGPLTITHLFQNLLYLSGKYG